ncbi:MBL fold metallo-hydrolase [Patescibacteria group bacterium]|nr:MBL fold metallo-hydrolase [Patescibacteria group bacterium]
MQVTFYGAAQEVTGSKHLLSVGQYKILLDCGSFQGRRQETYLLNKTLPFDAKQINAVILSHGHLDHSGLLPLLIKKGFKGKIYATSATIDIVRWLLLDSAKIQEQDAKYMGRHKIKGAKRAQPLYNKTDVDKTMKRFIIVPFVSATEQSWQEILPGLKIKMYQAGHILGSAVTVIQSQLAGQTTTLAYSGDLGRANTPLIDDPEYIKESVDALILESTYGNRRHDPFSLAVEKIKEVINSTAAKQGKIIIPAFALGRTQEIIYLIHKLMDQGQVPNLPIYVDSPLATHLTEVFKTHRELYDTEAWQDFLQSGRYPLAFKNLTYVSKAEDSKKLNTKKGSFIVIAGSGMCEAGRVLHHLINGLGDNNNTVLITGFQAANTLGRRLVEGANKAKLFGHDYPVRARIEVLNELSAHADSQDLVDYATNTPNLKKIFLVHGEFNQAQSLQNKLRLTKHNWQVTIPARGDTFKINS